MQLAYSLRRKGGLLTKSTLRLFMTLTDLLLVVECKEPLVHDLNISLEFIILSVSPDYWPVWHKFHMLGKISLAVEMPRSNNIKQTWIPRLNAPPRTYTHF